MSAGNEANFEAINRTIEVVEKRATSLDDIRQVAEFMRFATGQMLEPIQRPRVVDD